MDQCGTSSKQWFVLVVIFIFIGYFFLSIHEGNRIASWQNNPVPQPIQVPINATTEPSMTKNVMVVTSWRSGSTLIGELLNSYPNSFYSYEPLYNIDIRRAYAGNKDSKSADKVITGLLTCNYTTVFQECK